MIPADVEPMSTSFFFLLLFPLYKLILAEKLFAIYETRSVAAATTTTKRDESKSSIK